MVRREAKFENGYIGVRSWRLNLVLYLISLADEVTHWRTRLHICLGCFVYRFVCWPDCLARYGRIVIKFFKRADLA